MPRILNLQSKPVNMELPPGTHLSLHSLLGDPPHSDKETKHEEIRYLPKRTELIKAPRVAPCLQTYYPGPFLLGYL